VRIEDRKTGHRDSHPIWSYRFELPLKLHPDDLDVRRLLAQAGGGIGQKEKQIALHRENVEREPNQAWTHLQLAWAYGPKDPQNQKVALKKCLSLHPKEATTESRARLTLAVIYTREERYGDAEELLLPALGLPLEPFFRAEIHAHLAETFAYQGKTDRCIQHTRRTIVMDEENVHREFFRTKKAFVCFT